MSDKRSKKSKEEIARQFDLPERKSKIATILQTQDVAYCVCRTSDSSRFMICCDACEEWYHGDCINITEKEAKHIKQYFCISCKEKDPSLMVVFRPVPAAAATQPPSFGHAGNSGHHSQTTTSKKGADDKKLKKRKEHKSTKHQREEKKMVSCFLPVSNCSLPLASFTGCGSSKETKTLCFTGIGAQSSPHRNPTMPRSWMYHECTSPKQVLLGRVWSETGKCLFLLLLCQNLISVSIIIANSPYLPSSTESHLRMGYDSIESGRPEQKGT